MKSILAGFLALAAVSLLSASTAHAESATATDETAFSRALQGTAISDAELADLLSRMRFVRFDDAQNLAVREPGSSSDSPALKSLGLVAQRTQEPRHID